MTELFADTGYWIALQMAKDALHSIASHWSASIPANVPIITSDLVLIEYINYVSGFGPASRREAARVWDNLHAKPGIIIVPATQRILQDAVELFERSSDKLWSLTDCSSFIIMRERKIQDALTYDRHFEQAGFSALLRAE